MPTDKPLDPLPDALPDPRSLTALRQRFGPRHRWWVLTAVMIGNMAALMAATTINVAVPASASCRKKSRRATWAGWSKFNGTGAVAFNVFMASLVLLN